MKDFCEIQLQQILDLFTEYCIKEFGNCLESIVVYGSVARGEFLPGISDIDIIIVFKEECWKGDVSEETFPIPTWIASKLLKILDEIYKELDLKKPVIDARATTINIIKKGLDPKITPFWLHNIKSGYKVLYGKDVFKEYVPSPITRNDVIKALEYALKTVKLLSKARLIGKKELTLHDKAKACINNAIIALQAFLCLYGDFIPSKKKACEEFKKKFNYLPETKIASELYQALLSLNQLTKEEIENTIAKSITLIQSLIQIVKNN